MKTIFYKLGARPKRSAQFFFYGLISFWLFAAVIWWSLEQAVIWFYIGLIGLMPSFGFAVYGYLGIFANRYAQVLQAAERNKKANSTN